MLPQLSKIRGAALDLLFPQRCLGCGKEGELICAECQKQLPRINHPICPRCGKPQPSGIICPDCVNWHASIDCIRSPFKFDGVVREAVHQFKYKNLRSLVQTLAVILRDYLLQYPLTYQVLVPVPLHPSRIKERGYNQSELLARKLGELVNIPVDSQSLQRVKYVLPQARTQSVEERYRNVRQAFGCCKSILQYQKVLLIDDVTTTGATLDACAAALKSAGVTSVCGLALAREI